MQTLPSDTEKKLNFKELENTNARKRFEKTLEDLRAHLFFVYHFISEQLHNKLAFATSLFPLGHQFISRWTTNSNDSNQKIKPSTLLTPKSESQDKEKGKLKGN